MSCSVIRESVHGEEVIVLGLYSPWRAHKEAGGNGANYPTHSARILDVKYDRPSGFPYFVDFLKAHMRDGRVMCIVPSHDPSAQPGALAKMAASLVAAGKCDDGAGCLVRHTKIQKLSAGGERSMAVHLNSINVTQTEILAGRAVILMDDVMTTGTSLRACKQLLIEAGAESVQCLALGRTPLQNPF